MRKIFALLFVALVYSTTSFAQAFDMKKAFKEADNIEKAIKRPKFRSEEHTSELQSHSEI